MKEVSQDRRCPDGEPLVAWRTRIRAHTWDNGLSSASTLFIQHRKHHLPQGQRSPLSDRSTYTVHGPTVEVSFGHPASH